MKHLFSIVFTAFLWLGVLVSAAPLSEQTLLEAASAWLKQNALFQQFAPGAAPSAVTALGEALGEATLAVVHLHPCGYVVMSTDDALPPVVAFSEAASMPDDLTTGSPLADLLKAQSLRFAALLAQPQTRGSEDYFARNRSQWGRLRGTGETRAAPLEPDPSTIIQPPLLSTLWGQNEPYNHYLPTSDNSTYIRTVAGCIPTAIAQIMKYHHWPPRGQGRQSHTDSSWGIHATLAANLALPFAWDVMQDAYGGGDPLAPANLAIARTCLALGVLFKSDYEIEGTATFGSEVPPAFANHLFFQSGEYKRSDISPHYSNYISQAALFANIRSDILARRPVYVGFSSKPNVSGHGFVVDGLLTDSGVDYYHFNYGWDGRHNGWYRLNDGHEDTVIDEGITNIQPQFMPQFNETAYEQGPNFTLAWQFPQYHAAAVTAFRLQATRNGHTDTLASNIPPDARSWDLANQPVGEVTYSLAAQKGGAWQPAATMMIAVTPAPAELQMAILTPVVTGFNTDPFVVDINVSDRPGLALSADTSRPDLFPAANLRFSGQGSNRTLTLTPAMTTRAGNVLVWITATVGKAQVTATADLLVNFPKTPVVGAGEAVNCPGQEFFTDGHVYWRVQTETAFSPPSALQGGGLDDDEYPLLYKNEFSRLYTYVTGPCVVAFQWKVSSQPQTEKYPDADYLIFAVNDVEIDRISGYRNWKNYTIVIPEPGTHTISWTYLRGDGIVYMYDDSGWIDDFSCVPLYPVNVSRGNASSDHHELAASILAADGDTVNLIAQPTQNGERFRYWKTEPAVNLADAASVETTFIMPATAVTVTAIFKADVEIPLIPGWNLVGLPVTLEAIDALPLAGLPVYACRLAAGQAHYARATTYAGGQAYWIFHDGANAFTLALSGQMTPAELPTEPGWHLVAPTIATPIPDHARAWKWNGKRYKTVAGGVITPPEAYWLYIYP